MRNKDESFDMFKRYKIEVENQKDREKKKSYKVIEVVNIFVMIFFTFVRNMV